MSDPSAISTRLRQLSEESVFALPPADQREVLRAAADLIDSITGELSPVYSTLSFLRSVIACGEPMTPEVRQAIDNAQERLSRS